MNQQAINTIRDLQALIKKANFMVDEIKRNATLRASDFDTLNGQVREAFESYTR